MRFVVQVTQVNKIMFDAYHALLKRVTKLSQKTNNYNIRQGSLEIEIGDLVLPNFDIS